MRVHSSGLIWALAAVLAFGFLFLAYPQVLPFAPAEWSITRSEAIDLAEQRLQSLGEPLQDPYVVVQLETEFLMEQRLYERQHAAPREDLSSSPLAADIVGWNVVFYEPKALPRQWTYRAKIGLAGELLALRMRVPDEEAAEGIDEDVARTQADAFLKQHGLDLSLYEEPVVRQRDREARTDLSLRYADRRALLGEGVPYGLQVLFAGDRLAGFEPWIEDPDREARILAAGKSGLWSTSWILTPFLLFPFVAFAFLRKYHEGEIGVRRAIQIFALVWGCGVIVVASTGRGAAENIGLGALSRQQTTWVWGLQLLILWFSVTALMASLCWAVGEARCRTRWGHKLAAFDALFQGRWGNDTVASASARGLAAAVILTALASAWVYGANQMGFMEGMSQSFGPWWEHSPWPGISLLAIGLVLNFYSNLFVWLFALPAAVSRLGTPLGALVVTALATFLFWPPRFLFPITWSFPLAFIQAGILILIFLRYDLLTALMASLGTTLLTSSLHFLRAEDPFLVFQGVVPLFALSLPLWVSLKYLGSGKVFEYRYQDIPNHVRRIAERERQRVELETARGIQTSILPELPPQLAGVELAHAYLPASEVGGDFYDVLDLEDGRLAVAVGDVAGHGVSSGLVMSMAKSTLALQVTVDPEVETVVSTLNRMVYRSARQRLLTTLCYALVDTKRLELTYASAGHLAPYRVSQKGEVQALAAAAYPLGVRDHLQVQVRSVPLEAGDSLFLFSDGLVEARNARGDELFGFERLEKSLRKHSEGGATELKDGVLADIRKFAGNEFREDDQTILVLKLPD